MKVLEVVDKFMDREIAKCGNLKTERHDNILYLVHFDTDIAYINTDTDEVFINRTYYSRTTSKFTQYLRLICKDLVEYDGTPSHRVHYYAMGEKR